MLRSSSSHHQHPPPSQPGSSAYLPFRQSRSPSPPPLLGYSPSKFNKHKHKSSRPLNGFSNFINSKLPSNLTRFSNSHSSLIQSILVAFILITLLFYLFGSALILFRFKIHNGLMSSGWIGTSMSIRKQPILFVQSSQSVAIVWETNKLTSSSGREVTLRYWTVATGHHNHTWVKHPIDQKHATSLIIEPTRVRPKGDDGWKRWIHSSLLENLVTGTTYAYELILVDPHHLPKTDRDRGAVKKVFATHQFTWLGIDPPDLHHVQHLSTTSPSAADPINVLHIAVIGDNQFGVNIFRQIVKRMMNIKSYVPPLQSIFGPRQIIHHFYPSPTKPNLVFHVGDAVQDAHNLRQWQTDFWDPYTFKSKLSSEIPIVYARGNHDFDAYGLSLYTGGLPKVQIGELNRTQNWKLTSQSPLEIPGIAEADRNYTTFKAHPRDPYTRGTYHAYSPHPRVRVLVCDSNLEPTREAYPGSRLSEVDEHERWLLWEMARPEWKEASIRIIIVHVPPFVEYWDPGMWIGGHESLWGQYVRTRFASHFHATSPLTRRYDIPPASLVISGHSHAYSRGLLANFVSEPFFEVAGSSFISRDVIRAAKAEHKKHSDPSAPQPDDGVVYVVTGGAGGPLDMLPVEDWGFYERSIPGKHHFGHIMLDMSATLLSIDEWGDDWQDSRDKRSEFQKKHVRVYRLTGSQLVCAGTNESWEAGHYQAADRLVWTTVGVDGKILDRFIIEANSCR